MRTETVPRKPLEFDHAIDTSVARSGRRLSDRLARSETAQQLAEMLLAHPGVVGVYGSWGSGKSFVLDLTIDELFDRPSGDRRRPIVCYFQPWRFEPDTSLAPGLIKALSDVHSQFPGLNPTFGSGEPGQLREAAGRLLRLMRRIVGVAGAISPAAAGVLPPPWNALPAVITLTDVTAKEVAKLLSEDPGSAASPDADWDPDQIKETMGKLIKDMRESAAKAENAADGGNPRKPDDYRVIVVIDDLDRCAPDLMVDMLNWLKVHLTVPGCSYLLALDHGAASKAIVGKYRAYLGENADVAYGLRYLEKIVDYEVELSQSPYVEQMATQEVAETGSVIDIIERLVHRQGVRLAETRRLVQLPTLQSPRTMLKVVSRYAEALSKVQLDQAKPAHENSEARQLPADYSFWLLLLVAMYYRLSPPQIEAFCHGQGPLANSDPEELNDAGSVEDPLPEFRDFLDATLRDSQGERTQPTPAVLFYLYTAVRQLAVPGRPIVRELPTSAS